MEKIVYSWLDDEKTAILCTYREENWTWDDFYRAFQTQKTMLESVPHTNVHVIVDVRKSHLMPKGGSLLSGIRKLGDQKHPQQGHTIIVGATGMVAAIARMLGKLLGEHRQEVHMVDTMEQAYELLARIKKQPKPSKVS
jgi:hypothetical protein